MTKQMYFAKNRVDFVKSNLLTLNQVEEGDYIFIDFLDLLDIITKDDEVVVKNYKFKLDRAEYKTCNQFYKDKTYFIQLTIKNKTKTK